MRPPFTALALLILVATFWTHQIALGGGDGRGFGDINFYYYPLYEAAYSRLFDAPLSLWNPYELCGIPWLATLQGGFLYPPHVLYTFLPTSYGLATSTLLHLCIIALSTAALARRIGLSNFALVAAVALATLSSRYATMLLTPNTLEAAAWLPLGTFAVVGLARGKVARSSSLLGACLGLSILAGYPQATAYCVYSWGALCVLLVLSERPTIGVAAQRLGGFAGAIAMGTLVAGVQLFPTFELAAEGTRSLTSLNPTRFSVFPAPKGILRPEWGLLAVALFPAALFSRRHRALGMGAVLLCITTLLFSWGLRTPAYQLYLSLPLLDSFRFPHRILFVTDFFFALSAAIGLDSLLNALTRVETGSATSGNDWPSNGAVVAAVIAAATLAALGRGFAPSSLAPLLLLLGAIGAALVSSRSPGPTPRRIALAVAAALAATVLAESYGAPRRSWDLPYSAAQYPAASMRPPSQLERIRSPGERVLLLSDGLAPAVFPKLATVYRIPTANGYEPMNLRRQAEYFTFLKHGTVDVSASVKPFSGRIFDRRVDPKQLAKRKRLLDLAAVRTVVASGARKSGAQQEFVESLRLERRKAIGKGTQVFENKRALPRAFVTYEARSAPPAFELLELLSRPGFDPLVASYVETEGGDEGEPLWPADVGTPGRGAPANILIDSPEVVEIEATLEAPGLLVLADTYYTGWQASVDGEPAEILATNHLFRGVRVPAGSHTVRFEYRPWSIWAGLAGSILGITCLIATWRRGAS